MYKDYKLKVKPLDQVVLDDFNPLKYTGIVNFWVPEYSDIYLMTTIIKTVSGKEKPFLIDLGCGGGLCSRLFSDIGVEVLGVDSDEKLIKKAEEVYGRDGLQFLEGSVENLRKIVKARKIGKVDAVYCSFMPEEENWTPFILKLKPDVILHVLERYGEKWVSGSKEAYEVRDGYEIYGAIPLFSYRDFDNLDSLSLETASTWLVTQVREDLLERLIKKFGSFKELVKRNMPTQRYPWEIELDIELEKAKSKSC